jgi:hypothetical protein
MEASGADDGHSAPAALGNDATAPSIADLAGFVEQLGIAPAPPGSVARRQVNAARVAIRRVMKQYDVLPESLFGTVVRAGLTWGMTSSLGMGGCSFPVKIAFPGISCRP